MTTRDAARGELMYRRVRVGNALGRIERAELFPGRWSFGRRYPDTWHVAVRTDNGMLIHARLDQVVLCD